MSALLVSSAATAAPAPVASGRDLSPTTQFAVRHPDAGAQLQIDALRAAGDKVDANLLSQMLNLPQAFWFTAGTPAEVQASVKNAVMNARAKGTVPVLVAYNIPYRDCAQYSSGGASNTAEYEAWIDAFAAGIGNQKAVVILEPDSLGIIPWYTNINGQLEWCQPTVDGQPAPEADPAHRFAQLNHAVDALEADANVSVYLDGTHSGWLGVGDNADRLVKGGVKKAQGFYLNVSNFQYTANSVQYGTWVSKCIDQGGFGGCANQYWNGGPDGTMIASLLGAWNGVAMSNFGEWSDTSTNPALNTSGINARFWGQAKTHFVIDTSRNAVGPWAGNQDWCNPPDRGLGLRPSANTGNAAVDAYLWIKTPGESDGQCDRGSGTGIDTVRGYADPAAGAWFPQMALELAQHASPPLPGGRPNPAW